MNRIQEGYEEGGVRYCSLRLSTQDHFLITSLFSHHVFKYFWYGWINSPPEPLDRLLMCCSCKFYQGVWLLNRKGTIVYRKERTIALFPNTGVWRLLDEHNRGLFITRAYAASWFSRSSAPCLFFGVKFLSNNGFWRSTAAQYPNIVDPIDRWQPILSHDIHWVSQFSKFCPG